MLVPAAHHIVVFLTESRQLLQVSPGGRVCRHCSRPDQCCPGFHAERGPQFPERHHQGNGRVGHRSITANPKGALCVLLLAVIVMKGIFSFCCVSLIWFCAVASPHRIFRVKPSTSPLRARDCPASFALRQCRFLAEAPGRRVKLQRGSCTDYGQGAGSRKSDQGWCGAAGNRWQEADQWHHQPHLRTRKREWPRSGCR